MAYGLRLRDETGNVILDSSKRLGRLLGQTNTGTTNGSISPSGADQGNLFYVVLEIETPYPLFFIPQFEVSATTISWDWGSSDTGDRYNVHFMYGVR